MITIQQEITHHGRAFSIFGEKWPEADGAAKAVRWARDWIESQTPETTSLLHGCMTRRQLWQDGHSDTLAEADEAMRQARQAGLPAYSEEPPRARFVTIRADEQDEEDDT